MKSKVRQVLKSMILTIILTLVCSNMVFAEETTQFVTGTSINGIGIGGLTVEEAKVRIEGFYSGAYQLTITKKGGTTELIKGVDINYKVTVPEGLQAILEEQNTTGRKSGPSVDNSHTMQMGAVYEEEFLTAQINSLSCISDSNIVKTADAYVSAYQEGQPFTIIPEVQGNNLDLVKVTALIKEAVGTGKAAVNLEEGGCYCTVTVTADNEALKKLCKVMNQCKDMTITYTFGEKTEVLTGAVICTWLTGMQDGQISVNREAVAAYIKSLADKYNTVNTARNFHTTGGKDVSLKGSLGWKIDEAAETDALIALIKTGQIQSREPLYSQSAASRTGSDWGNTYVEIDLSGQHVYMYRDSAVIWDAPCVTGNVSKNHTTPEGIYSLTYKQENRVLRGEKKADGTFEYESHVNYWMPFNGGIGLHDAAWRDKFGGTIYQYGGSHGCINLPSDKTKALYESVYPGIPVLVYK